MSDIPNRDEVEASLARKISPLLKRQMGQLLEMLGDPPRLENITAEFWDKATEEFTNTVRPFLQELFEDQAAANVERLGVGVDWSLINQRAATWASQYTFDLVTGITATTRETLQGAVSRYYQDGLTIGQLEDSIIGSFGPVRAEMIAVTEITRASTQGERALLDELSNAGITMRPIFQTNMDELVCPICGPMQGKQIQNDSEYPPLHPRCRCWTNLEFVK
jgi:hypothetical protein